MLSEACLTRGAVHPGAVRLPRASSTMAEALWLHLLVPGRREGTSMLPDHFRRLHAPALSAAGTVGAHHISTCLST